MIIRDFLEKKQIDEITFKQIYFYFQKTMKFEVLRIAALVLNLIEAFGEKGACGNDLDEYFFEEIFSNQK